MQLRRKRFSRGQIFVITTLIMATLLGGMALSADVGLLYFNWVQLQKAADAAALAGAEQLTAQPDQSGTVAANATAAAKGYACLNGINDSSNSNATICPNPVNNPNYVDKITSITVDPNNTQITVNLTRQVPYYFATLIGLQKGNVAAAATAQVSSSVATYTGGLFPAGVQCNSPCNSYSNVDPGQSMKLGQKFVGGLAAGNWGWLDLGQGNGASQLGNAVANGVPGTYTIGQGISSSPGNKGMSGPVNSGFQSRLNLHTSEFPKVDPNSVCTANGGNPPYIPPGDPLLVTVPAVDFTGCHGKCSMNIEGFVQVYLTSQTSGSIDGCFVQAISSPSVGSTTAPQLGALAPPVLTK